MLSAFNPRNAKSIKIVSSVTQSEKDDSISVQSSRKQPTNKDINQRQLSNAASDKSADNQQITIGLIIDRLLQSQKKQSINDSQKKKSFVRQDTKNSLIVDLNVNGVINFEDKKESVASNAGELVTKSAPTANEGEESCQRSGSDSDSLHPSLRKKRLFLQSSNLKVRRSQQVQK